MTFRAQYYSTCKGCNNTVYPGDDVEYMMNQIVHLGCVVKPESKVMSDERSKAHEDRNKRRRERRNERRK